MNKKLFLSFFSLIFILMFSFNILAISNPTYTTYGDTDYGLGIWNTVELPTTSDYSSGLSKAFSNAIEIVLHADVDNDGEQEYIVYDGGQIEIYNLTDNNFVIETSWGLSPTPTFNSEISIQLINFDSDDEIEIVYSHAVGGGGGNLYFETYEWDGENLTHEYTNTSGSGIYNVGGMDMVCENQICYTAMCESDQIFVYSWDKNGRIDSAYIDNAYLPSGHLSTVVFPKHQKLWIVDLDLDGVYTLVFNFAFSVDDSIADSIYLLGFDLDPSGAFVSTNPEILVELESGHIFNTRHQNYAATNFTNLLIKNFDTGQDGSRPEIFMAYIDSDDDSRLYGKFYTYTGNQFDSWNTFDLNYISHISNAFLGENYPGSYNAACVLGISDTDSTDTLIMQCEDRVHPPDSVHYIPIDIDSYINSNRHTQYQSRSFFAGTMDDYQSSEALDIREIVSIMGVLRPLYIESMNDNPTSLRLMSTSFNFGNDGQNYFPVGVESTTHNDLIMIDNSSMKFYNDDFLNNEPFATINFTPSNLNVKTNTNVLNDIYVIDPEGDDVSARVCYYTETVYNVCSPWVSNQTSPLHLEVYINASTEVEGATIILYVQDNIFPFNNFTVVSPLNVRENGAITGTSCGATGCNPTIYLEELEEAESDDDSESEDDLITTSLEDLNNALGLGLNLKEMLTIFIIIGIGSIWWIGRDYNDKMIVGGVSMVFAFFCVLLGVFLKIYSSMLFLTILIFAGAVLVIFFVKKITGD